MEGNVKDAGEMHSHPKRSLSGPVPACTYKHRKECLLYRTNLMLDPSRSVLSLNGNNYPKAH